MLTSVNSRSTCGWPCSVAMPRIRNRRSCWSGGRWPLMTGAGLRSWRRRPRSWSLIAPAPVEWGGQARASRGLVEEDPAALDWAATTYSSLLGRAWATEDAGMACAQQGNRAAAVDRLQEAYALYQKLDVADCMDRVRARLRTTGVRVRHWSYSDRPAFGWASLTDTERRIAYLVAQGLSNRQIASHMFLSVHTSAFPRRRVFCKLDVSSRVQLAGQAAEQDGSPLVAGPPAGVS